LAFLNVTTNDTELERASRLAIGNTTRNYLICDAFFVTFSENITKSTVSTTYSRFSSQMCPDVYSSPEHCDVFLFFITDVPWWIFKPRTLRRIPIFRHGCALVDIQAQNDATRSCFSLRMCTYGYSSPEHCDDLLNSSKSSTQRYDILADLSRSINKKLSKN
jgi:hypothetical protein